MKKVIADFLVELEASDDVLGYMIFGSYARGDQREGSDIDILVLVKKGAWRDVEIRDGQVFEMVYASLDDAKSFYEKNPNDAVQQWTDGDIVYDPDGRMSELKDFVDLIKKHKKPKLAEKEIKHFQFDREDKVRAIEYFKEKDFSAANLQLDRLGQEMLEIYFDLHQLWTPAPKQRLEYLRDVDSDMAKLFDEFFTVQDFEKRLEVIKVIVERVFSK